MYWWDHLNKKPCQEVRIPTIHEEGAWQDEMDVKMHMSKDEDHPELFDDCDSRKNDRRRINGKELLDPAAVIEEDVVKYIF